MSEGLPGPGGGAEGGAGRAGVGGDRPHGAGLRRLDEGGAVRRARGSGPLVATDAAWPVAARGSSSCRMPSAASLASVGPRRRETPFKDCRSLQTESDYSDWRKALCL